MGLQKVTCHKCGHSWEFDPPLGRRDTCPKCSSDCRVCRNCRFFDAHSYRECAEPQADWVKEKDEGNFCGYFAALYKDAFFTDNAPPTADPLDQLFKNLGSSASASSKAPLKLSDELDNFFKNKK